MNKKILFLTSIILITILLFLSFSIKKEKIGIIREIKYSNNKITILLENSNEELIIFNSKNNLNLSINDKIIYFGKKEIYKSKEQIIIDYIIKND